MHRRYAAILAALVCACLLAACGRTEPEQALRERFAALQESIGKRDAGAVQQFLAEDFVANGGLDRDQTRRMATMYFLRNTQVGVTVGPLDLRMQPPDNATVTFSAILTGGSGGWMPERGQVYSVITAWRMQGDDWVMYHAQWTPEL